MDRTFGRTLADLLETKPARAWRLFVDTCTPFILSVLERSGLTDHDEAMDVYVLVCRRLCDDGFARLKQYDPEQGSLRSWLGTIVRRTTVDWIRSRAGRRRLFQNVRSMEPIDQQCFELFFWEGLHPGEIVEALGARTRSRVTLIDVLDSLDRVHETLTARQRGELLSLSTRNASVQSFDGAHRDDAGLEPVDPRPSSEARLAMSETRALFDEALGRLSNRDAAIVRLKYVQGLSLAELRRALHLDALTYRDVYDAERRLEQSIERSFGTIARDALHNVPLFEAFED